MDSRVFGAVASREICAASGLGGVTRNIRLTCEGLLLVVFGTQFVISTAAASELSAREIAQQLRPSIVQIGVEVEVYRRFWLNDERTSSRTGFIFRADEEGNYWVLTNSHVLGFDDIVSERKQAPELVNYGISIRMSDDEDAEILRVLQHEELDAAILVVKTEGSIRQAIKAAKESVEVGDQVYAMGYALGGPLYFTRGIVSMVDHQAGEIGTDAAINPGNSGGPLVNDRGHVVGVNIYIFDQSEGMGFATQIDQLSDLDRYVEFDFSDPTAVADHLNNLYFD